MEKLASVYAEWFASRNKLETACDGSKMQVAKGNYLEPCPLGEAITTALTEASDIKKARASSSQITTFSIGTFIHRLFSKYTNGLLPNDGPVWLECRE